MVMEFSYNDVLEHVELNNMLLAAKGCGVIYGLDVSERGAGANMSVDVAMGSCIVDYVSYYEASTVNVAISAAHATLARKDIIVYDTSAGNPAAVTGTAASTPVPPDIPNGDILLALIDVPATDTTISSGQITDKIILTTEIGYAYSASDTSLKSDDTEETSASATYVKLKEIDVVSGLIDDESTLRIKFDMHGDSSSFYVYGRIYRNGVAVGTEQTEMLGYDTKSEDIAGWSSDDHIQLYVHRGSAGLVSIRNFWIYGTSGVVDTRTYTW